MTVDKKAAVVALKVRGSVERAKVLTVLKAIRPHKGRESAISMHDIAAAIDIDTRTIQALVKFLVEECYCPIGTATSRPFGYFWLASMDERRAVRNHFVRRALSNLKHARAYDTDAIVAPLIGQLAIDFPEVAKS